MKRSDRFKPGDLAWVSVVNGVCLYRKVNDDGIHALSQNTSVVIIRAAMAKDYSKWYRRSPYEPGKSYARMLAEQTWLAMPADGVPILIQDGFLNKRRYKPRKKKQ